MLSGIAACSVTDSAAMNSGTDNQQLIAGIESVDSTADGSSLLDVIFYVANQGDTDVDMLVWNTPFEKILSADVFKVEHNGEPVPYNGRKVKRGTPQADSFITVPAGERIETLLNMTTYYAMEQAGEYSVVFEPVVIGGVSQLNELTPVELVPGAVSLEIVE